MFILLATLALTLSQTPPPQSEATRRVIAAREHIGKADGDRQSGRFEAALSTCKKYLEDPSFDPTRFPERSEGQIAAAEIRGMAQKCYAETLEASGNYDAALIAWRDACEKFPSVSFCGNCGDSMMSFARISQARCLERLSRYREAIDLYFSVLRPVLGGSDYGAAARIVVLYEAAGQIDKLRGDLGRRDQDFLQAKTRQYGKTPDPGVYDDYLPSRGVLPSLDLYDAEKAGRWSELIAEVAGKVQLKDRGRDAMGRLARNPEVTVPLLSKELLKGKSNNGWVAYTIGLCGGPEAVTTLKTVAQWKRHGVDWEMALRGLDLTGEPGRVVLRELSTDPEFTRKIDEILGKGGFEIPLYVPPPIPKGLKLD